MKKVFKSKAHKDNLKGHKDGLIKVFSPDGPESGLLISASKDGCIRAWDLVNRKIITKLFLSRDFSEFNGKGENPDEFDEDEEDIMPPGTAAATAVVETAIGSTSNAKAKKDQMTSVCFSANGMVFAGFDDGVICSWSMKTGELLSTYSVHTMQVNDLQFLTENQLVSASKDATIRIWDVKSGMNETVFSLSGAVDQMRVDNKNTIQAIVNKNTYVEMNVKTEKIVRNIKFMSTSVTCFLVHEKELFIATTANVIEVYALDALEGVVQPAYIVENNKDWVLCMNVLNGYLFTGGDDKRIKVWDIANKLCLVEDLIGHDDGVVCMDFAGSMLYSGSFDHSIRSWSLTEMNSRIHERELMFREDIWSRKYDAWYKVIYKKKKKKGKKGGKKK